MPSNRPLPSWKMNWISDQQGNRNNSKRRWPDLEKAKRDSVAAMNATQKNSADYRQELEKLRTDVLQAQQDRDAHFKEVVRLTDLLNEAANEKELLRNARRTWART